MQKYFFKSVVLLGALSVLTFGAGVAKADNPVPTINALNAAFPGLSPSSVPVRNPAVRLNFLKITINGTGFRKGAVVSAKGKFTYLLSTKYVSETQLTVLMSSRHLTSARTYDLKVINPAPGAEISNVVPFIVGPVVPPALPPELKIKKDTLGGDGAFKYSIGSTITETVTTSDGTGEVNIENVGLGTTSVIETASTGWAFNSVSCDKTFTAGTNGVASVAIVDGQTTTCTFESTENTPHLQIDSVSDDKIPAGSPDTIIAVTGSGFTSTTAVTLNSTETLATNLISPGELEAVIPAGDLAYTSTLILDFFNPSSMTDGEETPQNVNFAVTVTDEGATTSTTTTPTPTTTSPLDIVYLLQSLATAAVSGAMLFKVFKRG